MGREEAYRVDLNNIGHWYVYEIPTGRAVGRTLRVGTEITFWFSNESRDKRRARFVEARKSEVGNFEVIEATDVISGGRYLLCPEDIITVHRTVTSSPDGPQT